MLFRSFVTLIVLTSGFVSVDAREVPYGKAYAGVGFCFGEHQLDGRDPGYHLSIGLGRVYSQLNEVVARASAMFYKGANNEGLSLPTDLHAYAVGLDLKWNLGRHRSPVRTYFFVGTGGLGMYLGERWRSDAYLGGGFGMHSGSGKR
ncbi:MAG: hypothetical protein OEV68_17155, partial [candidate division Zixibacteria bacterium]|nr:hypothetical protein [candidate division Zixibacteria bacterium]